MYLEKEKREQEDLPASKTALTHQLQRLEDDIEKDEQGLITAIRNDTDKHNRRKK